MPAVAEPSRTPSHLPCDKAIIWVSNSKCVQDCYKPHPLVEATLNGVLILLKRPATLLAAQTTLQAPDFKSRLLEFNVSSLDDATLHRLKRSLDRPLLTVEVSNTTNMASLSICLLKGKCLQVAQLFTSLLQSVHVQPCEPPE